MLPEGILLIDKPVGITSFDVIRRLRREPGVHKIGHAGTLDPLASGLMIVGVGEGTKKLTEYIKLPKEYIAEILVGERRSTGDMEGKVVEEKEVASMSRSDIEAVLKSMVGTYTLTVSAYSAIKKDGVPFYKRARKAEREGGEVEDLPVRDMRIDEAEYLEHACDEGRCSIKVRLYVASGTYIRSLAEEFGRRLGYPATLKSLRRTKVGNFDIKDARKV